MTKFEFKEPDAKWFDFASLSMYCSIRDGEHPGSPLKTAL